MRSLLRWTLLMGLAVTTVLSVRTVPEAVAADVLFACIQDPDHDGSGRLLRIVGPNERCRRRETRVSWNVTGPQGPQGEPGSAGPAVPSGAVLFFALETCPTGWSELLAAQGRYIVGVPLNGTLGAEVGTALVDQEDRPVGRHSHGVNDPGHQHSYFDSYRKLLPTSGSGYILPRQSPAAGLVDFMSAGDSWLTEAASTGITIGAAGSVDGTNAPYLQLLACYKD